MAALSLLLCWLGCAPDRVGSPEGGSGESLDAAQAALVAARLANEEALVRYGVEPFSGGDAEAVAHGGRWHWYAVRSYGLTDLAADISFENDCSQTTVRVTRIVDERW